MTIPLTGSGGLFTRLGALFGIQLDLWTAAGTTVPVSLAAALTEYEGASLAVQAAVESLPGAIRTNSSNAQSSAGPIQAAAKATLLAMARADNPPAATNDAAALAELIRQMIAEGESVDASTVTITPTALSGNVGDGLFVATLVRGDGKTNELALAETITLRATNATSLKVTGATGASSPLSPDWPQGSGTSTTLSVTNPSTGGLLTNGSFDTAETTGLVGAPTGWDVTAGAAGTNYALTVVEQQTVAVSGTPTSGGYYLHFTDASSRVSTTALLPFNATANQVQTALRTLPGLASVTVTASGTSPNLTHTVVFTGCAGNVAQLTSTNLLDTGSIAHATTVAGSADVYAPGRALELIGNGAHTVTMLQDVTLSPATVYAVSVRLKQTGSPSAGSLRFELFDGNAVISSDASVANALVIDCTTLTTSYVAHTAFFRTPSILPPDTMFRLRTSTAISNGDSVFVDHLSMVAATKLYPGGPFAAAFAGAVPFIAGDGADLAVTNDRAGLLHELMDRNFGLRAVDLLLPSDSSGTETIPDSLVL